MTVEDFKKWFADAAFTWDPSEWYHAYWMALGDGDQVGAPARSRTCGSHCMESKFIVKSFFDQTIHIGFHVHARRQYVEEPCTQAADEQIIDGAKAHFVAYLNLDQGKQWDSGSGSFDPYQAEAGEEIEITLEIDWTRPHMAKDFAVTAWGEVGKVTITESSGKLSASYRVFTDVQPELENVETPPSEVQSLQAE